LEGVVATAISAQQHACAHCSEAGATVRCLWNTLRPAGFAKGWVQCGKRFHYVGRSPPTPSLTTISLATISLATTYAGRCMGAQV
jgi:hypothetical protein